MADETIEIAVGVVSTMGAGRSVLEGGMHVWGCGNVDDVVLVFSELITNAVVHTPGASSAVITHEPPNVRIEVHDGSHVIPELRHDTDPGGFGLQIVSRLSGGWGWVQTPTGKVVWSIMACGH
jgi:hypothetical protein